MGISLVKGGNLSLTKAAPGLSKIMFGLVCYACTTTGDKFDLDASALGCSESGTVISNDYFIFFNQKRSPEGAIEHLGDNRTGEGAGDDEVVAIDLNAAPANLDKVVFVTSIYDSETSGTTFGQVRNAYIRVVNSADNSEMARYDLSEDASVETAMVFGELYRHGAEWKFRAIGQGYSSGLSGIAKDYGVNL